MSQQIMFQPTTNSDSSSVSCWAVFPAAGVGARMGADCPKQYLPLAGRTVIEHSLDAVLNHEAIRGGVVAISETDDSWEGLGYQHAKPLLRAMGGAERCHSVLNALYVLANMATVDDWVLVHDAARPCVRHDDISRLIEQCYSHPVGGILATPIKDTIKQSVASHYITRTIDRGSLWYAQTPQMFRLGMLHHALGLALSEKAVITDEASALEHIGQDPLLIEGHADNLKITRPEDLALAEFYFSQR
jgi:2-C-methyl-D-erythritol 4-phosphate cytidylyltransferase